MSGDKIRVLLADDHAVVRSGLKAVLGGARDIEVVGEAKTGREAVALAERLKPDVVVMDLSMPDLDGTSATKEILQKGLSTRVLVLTMHSEDDYLVRLMEAGAAGYLMKSAADRDLVDAIRAVARGDVYVAASAARSRPPIGLRPVRPQARPAHAGVSPARRPLAANGSCSIAPATRPRGPSWLRWKVD